MYRRKVSHFASQCAPTGLEQALAQIQAYANGTATLNCATFTSQRISLQQRQQRYGHEVSPNLAVIYFPPHCFHPLFF